MKKLLALCLCACLMSGCAAAPPPAADAVSDPMETTVADGMEYYLIHSEEALESIGSAYPLSGRYMLGSDLTLAGEWRSIGTKEAPFTGVFDGNGHTIYHLTVSEKSGSTGFFGATSGVAVRRLVLEDAQIHHSVSFSLPSVAEDAEFTDCNIGQSPWAGSQK